MVINTVVAFKTKYVQKQVTASLGLQMEGREVKRVCSTGQFSGPRTGRKPRR